MCVLHSNRILLTRLFITPGLRSFDDSNQFQLQYRAFERHLPLVFRFLTWQGVDSLPIYTLII